MALKEEESSLIQCTLTDCDFYKQLIVNKDLANVEIKGTFKKRSKSQCLVLLCCGISSESNITQNQ